MKCVGRKEGRKKEELHTARTSTGKEQLLKPKETKEELLPPAPILKSRPQILTNNGVEKLDHLHSQIVIIGRTEYGL